MIILPQKSRKIKDNLDFPFLLMYDKGVKNKIIRRKPHESIRKIFKLRCVSDDVR